MEQLVCIQSSSILQGGNGREEGGCFLHPVAGENRKQQLASSQLESAHTESQILSEFKCAWCCGVKSHSYPEQK